MQLTADPARKVAYALVHVGAIRAASHQSFLYAPDGACPVDIGSRPLLAGAPISPRQCGTFTNFNRAPF